jgi:Ni/Co efflux regulator RcnB
MQKAISLLIAGIFAAVAAGPLALAQDRKKEQVHKGTPEQGTDQKKTEKKDRKKDGTGSSKTNPAADKSKAVESKK